jgi:hypothetical protein
MYWYTDIPQTTTAAGWRDSVRRACVWLTDVAMIRECGFPSTVDFNRAGEITDWRGAFRGEYAAATRRWDVYGPCWHGGQAVKSLVAAAALLDQPKLLDEARHAADFVIRYRVADPYDPNHGLLLAWEDGHVNTTAIIESLDGLFRLAEATGEMVYREVALAAVRWVADHAWLPEEGLFREVYDPRARTYLPHPSYGPDRVGAPILDDAVFLTAFRLTGDPRYRAIAIATAERLLRDERPAGNWAAFAPVDAATGALHPRCGWWWGRPLAAMTRETGDDRYLAACRRTAQWYARAQRLDGGMFRDTTPDHRTPSFGHVTSAVAGACLLWAELIHRHGDVEWVDPLRRGLAFCRSMQFDDDVADPSLRGAVLEKVLHPQGRDAPPWYLRDLGTIFHIQAVCATLAWCPEVIVS